MYCHPGRVNDAGLEVIIIIFCDFTRMAKRAISNLRVLNINPSYLLSKNHTVGGSGVEVKATKATKKNLVRTTTSW